MLLDGGQNMKTHINARALVVVLGALVVALAAGNTALGQEYEMFITNNPQLPPEDGVYVTAEDVHAMYDAGATPGEMEIILQELEHAPKRPVDREPADPDGTLNPGGCCEVEVFQSTLDGQVVLVSAGLPSQPLPVHLEGPVTTIVRDKIGHETGTFDTEILSMNLSGATPFGQVVIQESPSEPSLGETTITDLGGGLWQIDSFFDVFTELSVDMGGGFSPWLPDVLGPTRVDLQPNTIIPEPASALLLAAGGALFARRKRR